MKTKPLPCPFCGKKPRFLFIDDLAAAPESDKGFWSLSCSRKSGCLISATACADTKAETIANWNTRAPSAS